MTKEYLISKITDYLEYLEDDELNNYSIIKKMFDWQENYECIDWFEFKEKWFYCESCKTYKYLYCLCRTS